LTSDSFPWSKMVVSRKAVELLYEDLRWCMCRTLLLLEESENESPRFREVDSQADSQQHCFSCSGVSLVGSRGCPSSLKIITTHGMDDDPLGFVISGRPSRT